MHQYAISKHFILLPIFLLVIVMSIKIETIFDNVFAASPSFVRQEIQNRVHDVIQIDDFDKTITRLSDNTSTNVAFY